VEFGSFIGFVPETESYWRRLRYRKSCRFLLQLGGRYPYNLLIRRNPTKGGNQAVAAKKKKATKKKPAKKSKKK